MKTKNALLLVFCGFSIAAAPGSAYEPWSSQPMNAAKGSAVTVENRLPAYQDSTLESSLDNGEYASAQTLVTSKLDSYPASAGAFGEAYLRTLLFESLIWQYKLSAAAAQQKRLDKMLSSLEPGKAGAQSGDDVRELKARVLDDGAWLSECQGNKKKADNELVGAIAVLKELRSADRQTWRYIECLSRHAAFQAADGDFGKAKQILLDALAEAQGSHSISPLNIAGLEETLGSVLYKLGDQAGATRHFSQADAIKTENGGLLRRYAPGPYWLSPEYTYIEGSPWSKKSFENGVQSQVIDIGQVTVQASVLRDKSAAKKAVQVQLYVLNRTNQTIEFFGRQPTLFVLSPKYSLARLIRPNDLAAQIEKKGEGKAKWIRFWGQGATQSVTTNYIGNMPFYGSPYNGAFPPMMGYNNYYNRSGGMTTMVTNIPDPIAEARAFEKADQVQSAALAKAADIRSTSLGPTDIEPNQSLNGSIFFDTPALSKKSSGLLIIPIGNCQFEFPISNIPDGP